MEIVNPSTALRRGSGQDSGHRRLLNPVCCMTPQQFPVLVREAQTGLAAGVMQRSDICKCIGYVKGH